MKMETEVTAHRAGRLAHGTQAAGDTVAQGDTLGYID